MTPVIHGFTIAAAITCAFGFGYSVNNLSFVPRSPVVNTETTALKVSPIGTQTELPNAIYSSDGPKPSVVVADLKPVAAARSCAPGLPPSFVKGDKNTKLAVLSIYRISAYTTQKQTSDCGCPFDAVNWQDAHNQFLAFQAANPEAKISGSDLSNRAQELRQERIKRCEL